MAAEVAAELAQVEAYLAGAYGPVSGRASVTFVGTEQVEVLRLAGPYGPTYATLGMSRHPMTDPTQLAPDLAAGPRAELVLGLAEPHDDVFRRLAVLAMSPWVEGLVVTAGASLDLGEPLWEGALFTAVLVGEPAAAADTGVDVFPLLPMTPNESAWRRVHGSAALLDRWAAAGTSLADPGRASVDLS
jgi:Suppressor of fused protein (SUFU)